MFSKRKAKFIKNAPLTELQKLNLHRGRVMFVFKGLASKARLDYDLAQYSTPRIKILLEAIKTLARDIEADMLADIDARIINARERKLTIEQEKRNEPDACSECNND